MEKTVTSLTVCVHLVDHVLQLALGRVLTERAHRRREFLERDRAVAVPIKDGERLPERCRCVRG